MNHITPIFLPEQIIGNTSNRITRHLFTAKKRLIGKAWCCLLIVSWFGSCTPSRNNQDQEVKALLSNSAGYLNEKGTAELNSGRYSSAEKYFREAISLTAYDPVLHNNMGVAFFHQGQLDSSIAAYQTAIRLRPQYAGAYRNLASAYFTKGEFSDALKAVETALRFNTQDAESFGQLAGIHEKLDQHDAAIRAYGKAIALAPTQSAYYNNLGALYFSQGRIESAIEQFRKALQYTPSMAEASFNMANALARECRLEESLVHYENALRQSPAMAAAENNMGLVLMAQGKKNEALVRFRHALAELPDADIVLYNLSVVLMRVDSAAAALPLIDHAIAVKPQWASYHRQRGAVLTQLGRVPEAMAAFHRAVAMDSNLAIGYNDLGNAYYAGNDPRQALLSFEKALELYPDYLNSRYFRSSRQKDQQYIDLLTGCDNAWEISADYASIYINLGNVSLTLGNFNNAEAAFKKAIALQPELPDPYESLAILYQQQKKIKMSREMAARGRIQRSRFALKVDSLAAAERYARQALQLCPRDAEGYAAMAAVYIEQEEWTDAEDQLKKGLKMDPHSYRLYLGFGQYYARRQQNEKALIYFQKALQIDSQSVAGFRGMYEALESLGRISEAKAYQAELHYRLGQELEYAGQWDRSLLEYHVAAELVEKNSRFVAAQGIILAKKHFNDEAEKKFKNALQTDSLETRALYGLGLVYGDQGEYAKAIPFLRKAVRLDSLFGQAHYSLAVNYYFDGRLEPARRHLKTAQAMGIVVRKELVDALQLK